MKKRNVLQLITGLPIGGAEKVLLDLCTHLDRSKVEPFVVGLNDEDDLKQDFESQGITVEMLKMKKTPTGLLKAYRDLAEFVDRHEIDLIHAHMFHPLLLACLLKMKKRRLKIVFTSHSENIGGKFRELFTYLSKACRDTDIVFSQSMISNMYKKNTVIVPNGVDVALFSDKMEKNPIFTFLSIGILRPGKNHAFLAGCAKYLKERGYQFRIDIVGSGDDSGDESDEIRAAIEANGVKDEVRMLGARRDIPQLLGSAHVFVMPSLFEGLPIVLLEAGAARLPILSTPVGSIPTLLDERSGYMADLDHFAERMEYILTHYGEAKSKAEHFYEKVNDAFSIQKMARIHEKIYLDIESERY